MPRLIAVLFGGAVRTFVSTSLAFFLALVLAGCGGSSSSDPKAVANNWQFTLVQQQPRPPANFLASGFLTQAKGTLSGSVTVPPSSQTGRCAGVGLLTGTINAQNLALQINEGGTSIALTGSLSSDGTTMTGTYAGSGGGCFNAPTTGTWSAVQIPTLTGSFTGMLTSSVYMAALAGTTAEQVAPVMVSGNLTQGPNDGTASSSTLTGTISAQGYPCFRTVSVTGTITGQNVLLSVYNFNASLIGTIGLPSNPATVTSDSTGLHLIGSNSGSGLSLGANSGGVVFGPCPPILLNGSSLPYDQAAIELDFQ
jgi:hypothetical protein